jgi:hypothetical protein
MEKARAMVQQAQAPSHLWAEAVNTANYITNILQTQSNSGVTPAGRFFGEPPSVGHLRVWGCLAYVHVDQKSWTKLDAKSIEGILVGYDANTKGYQIYIPGRRSVRISIDTRFDESLFPYTTSSTPSEPNPEPFLIPLTTLLTNQPSTTGPSATSSALGAPGLPEGLTSNPDSDDGRSDKGEETLVSSPSPSPVQDIASTSSASQQ